MKELYSHLLDIDPEIKVDVICYNTDSKKEKEKFSKFYIYRIPCIQILPGQFAIPNYLSLILTLFKLVSKNKYDVVHSNTRFFDHSWWTPILSRIIGTKSVMTDHCASHPVHRSKLLTFFIKFIDIISTFIFSRFYDMIMVTNKATKEFVYTLGIKNSEIVYGGVDTDFFHPAKRQIIRKIPNVLDNFSQNQIVVTFLGRMIYTKGPQLVLAAAKTLTEKYPHVNFIFGGGGEMQEELKTLGQMKHIYFTGVLKREQTAQLLANSDILVHPSIHHEGFPNVILEGGASGCAVVATDVGGVRELIEDKVTGVFIKPTKENIVMALSKLIEDSEKRKKLGNALRKKIGEKFSWNKIALEFRTILYRVKSEEPVYLNGELVYGR